MMQRISVKRRLGTISDSPEDDYTNARRQKHYHAHPGMYQNWRRNPTNLQTQPSPPYDKNLLALTHLNKKLDELTPNDLECLKAMIRVKETRAHTRRINFSQDLSDCQQPIIDLRDYTTASLGLCKYPNDLPDPRKQIENRYAEKDLPLTVTHDVLMNTNYLLLYRRHFDEMPSNDLKLLVEDKIFSINNSPSLDVVTALADETLTYIKFHRVHNLPVNPSDPYMSTVGLIKYAVFNRLNLGDLACILDGGGGRDREYQILRQLANKPTPQPRNSSPSFDVHRRPPSSFKHPIQQALATVAAFGRCIGGIKRSMLRSRGPFHIRDFDETSVTETYRCGMISELILGSLSTHNCQNDVCQIKLRKLLQCYRASMFFCPLNNTRRCGDGPHRRDVRYKRRPPILDTQIPKLAYGPTNNENRDRHRRVQTHAYKRTRHQRDTHPECSAAAVPCVNDITRPSDDDSEIPAKEPHIEEDSVKRRTNDESGRSPGECSADTREDSDSDQSSASNHNSDNEIDEEDGEIEDDDDDEDEGYKEQTDLKNDDLLIANTNPRIAISQSVDEDVNHDPEAESVWTASVTPLELQQIRVHQNPIPDNSIGPEIAIYDPSQRIEDHQLQPRSYSPLDDTMDCDLSYSEMDSD
ncbi:a69 [Rat cytomegalovirus ALL-03]|uniref:mRNA export factor ICP27 homolog n=2 Tax=Rat cytomegalovirus (isolate England) TaxID=1261657 RepID=A0A0F6R556_RCMVE|nr:a69 [Rat cytomegalovirus ALL-03]WEG71855.1 multifunctional expression regulator [Murid betaherpesvirus 8]WPH25245.1 multifunctional expression regulator [Murid betaherpesvirus 8]WPH25378.1 multifunctional expression regulator [Murid betaherpesvirus 8]